MATFPALTPSSRTFTPGDYPSTGFSTYSGIERRVRHSNVMLASQLRLSFIGLTEAEMLSILSHYQGQKGQFLSFDIPANLLSGFTAADFTLAGYSWRYAAAPQVDDWGDKRHTVTLTLETVPPEGAAIAGLSITITTSIAAGPATASSTAPGAALTVTASLAAGAADGGI